MEEKSITVVTNNVVADTIFPTTEKSTINGQKKKKRGAFSLLKAALFMLRQKPGEKSKSVQLEVASSGNWKKMLGSMRPLHLQDNPSPSPPPTQTPAAMPPPSVMVNMEQFEDVLPSASPAPSTSSAGTMSQYASANNLQELDKHDDESEDEDDETDKEFDDNAGDEMIDAKAEEFIAHFYEQMRLQHHRTRGKRRE
ncbi:hypothetical protein RJ639_014232 [Escallonia herrerae]|uniref:Uncharacterized protein n=1 Tax=Escallonia herrerae TaxID=1293975 RepID=A0AA88VL62_9ASTE|nr:hypothetical protein RJ639_014232 [Escallonia herrerae]